MAGLTPPDRGRCQAVRHEPFRVTGVNGRCPNKPTVIVIENEPGKDGQRGSMSLCAGCHATFETRFPAGHADAEPVSELNGLYDDLLGID